jgi:hypothetical protein
MAQTTSHAPRQKTGRPSGSRSSPRRGLCTIKRSQDGMVWELVAVQILGKLPPKQVSFK